MEIRSILVNVDLDTSSTSTLRYAIDLAHRFDAELIGLAADQPSLTFAGVDGAATVADFYQLERTEVEAQLAHAEAAFRGAVPATLKSQWRAYVNTPVAALLELACLADVIVTGSTTNSTIRAVEKLDLGELVLASGRPVLNVATSASEAKLDKVMIAWKDTREARRAVADALPFLKQAKEVLAVTIGEGDNRHERASLDDLVAWLGRHGVTARGDIIANPGKFVDILESTALAQGVDLLVSGGYGHSRMREWLFGGVTRNLLAANRLNRLLSN
ncbi:MAG: universal stress protein [Devosia sp.]